MILVYTFFLLPYLYKCINKHRTRCKLYNSLQFKKKKISMLKELIVVVAIYSNANKLLHLLVNLQQCMKVNLEKITYIYVFN